MEAAALVAAVAIPAYLWLRSPPAIAFAQRDWVVVGDLNNLTIEAAFDNSVQSAFRIGLEQSRYVNVLSDLKARDTLKLMQRDPAAAKIDRATGSEIAIRDGARALILPTLAEVGGRVRFTAEVVDPNSQATVYTESADGSGAESVLASMDTVDKQLRLKLGEALASVSKESKPLEQVATQNLDALKAFALAQQDYEKVHFSDALDLYRQALRLDPGFVFAHIGAARCYISTGRMPEVVTELKAALAETDRILPREQLFAEAMLASVADTPRAALAKWKVLVGVYPDDLSAQGDYGYFAWILANRYGAEVIKAALVNASSRNANPKAGQMLVGYLNSGIENYTEAVHYFDIAENDSSVARTVDLAAAHAAQRQWRQVDAALERNRSTGDADADLSALSIEAAIAADRGDWDKAWKILDDVNRQAPSVNPQRQLEFRIIELSLRQLTGVGADKSAQRDYLKQALAILAKAAPENRAEIQSDILFAAYLTARQGDAKLATDATGALGPEPASADYPALHKLFIVTQAEISLAQGKPAEAVKLLSATLDGSEFCLTHLALLDAYAAAGDNAAALAQAKWLATHRGRAYVEYAAKAVIPYAVVNSDLALLRQAELATALGRKDDAQHALDRFLAAWPQAEKIPAFAVRLKAAIAASMPVSRRN
jgi:putative peptide modification system cyclase